MQIRKKLPCIMLGLICVPLFILAIGIYIYSSNRLLTKCRTNITQLASSEGRALSALLEAKEHQVQVIATDNRLVKAIKKGDLEGASELFREVCKEEDVDQVFLINKDGKILLSSNNSNESVILQQQDMYLKVLQGQTIFSDSMFSYTHNNKVINITAPIFDSQGQVMGGVCEVIFNNSFSEFINTIQIDQTGYAYILDQNDYIIAHPDPECVGASVKSSIIATQINHVLSKGKNEGTGTYIYLGNEKYFSFYASPDIGWIICIVQDVKEMQQQAMMESLFIILTMVGVILSVVIASILLTNKITKPISELISSMEKTSAGNFNYYCSYNEDDEMGTLATHYNQMLKTIGESHDDLNKVCEELAVTQNELKSNIDELTKSKEALAISEARYKTTLNAIEEVIWEYNLQTKEFFATEKWEKLVGTSSKNINIQEDIKEVLTPRYIESLVLSIRSCMEGNTNIFSQELAINIQNKEIKWLLCKGYALKDKKGKIERLVGILTDITANRINEKRVKELAFFDVLTGCFNKQTFMETLDTCLSTEGAIKNAALLFIDLDDFKRVNDTLGHEIGDKLLNYVARSLTSLIPQDAFISRFGGDEFVIFKTKVEGLEQVQELIYSILNTFQENISINEGIIHMSCSIGIALYPQDGLTSDLLLKNADTAMYKAKESGKNSYSFYAPSMSRALDRKLLVEGSLRSAINANALFLQYQPIVDIHTGRTVAAEALLRLKDDVLGFISPVEFIPIAEETGLIVPTGDWVIETTLRELSYYRLIGYEKFSITINVSPLQMKNRSFLPKLKLVIQNAKIPPEFIKLEVTESVLMEDIEKSIELFNEIKQIGMKLALDDFGTGYSSLNYLRSIPIDILKIDKSFIDEITTSKVLSEIVDSIIDMAHALDVQVVAEGVETKEQLELLREKGCDLIQGYYYSKPLLANQLEERLEKERDEMLYMDNML